MKKAVSLLTALILILTVSTTAFAASGWNQDSAGWWYQNEDGSYAAGQWKQIDGSWYHFSSSGYMQTGWIFDGSWYYLYPSGIMATGWVQDAGSWYYMGSSGAMQTGWVQSGGTWYYMDSEGVMATGPLTIDGTVYNFAADGTWISGGTGNNGSQNSSTNLDNLRYNDETTEARKVLSYINAFRTGSEAWYWNEDNSAKVYCEGLQPLEYSYELEQVALLRAKELTELLSYTHTRPDGTGYWTAYQDVGCGLTATGECWACKFYETYGNTTYGYYSAPDVVTSLRENNADYSGQPHRRILLSESKYVGAAYIIVGTDHYWVLEFAN